MSSGKVMVRKRVPRRPPNSQTCGTSEDLVDGAALLGLVFLGEREGIVKGRKLDDKMVNSARNCVEVAEDSALFERVYS